MKQAAPAILRLLFAGYFAHLAKACSCPPPIQSVTRSSPVVAIPSLNATDTSLFVGVVENVYPKDIAQYEDLWFKVNHEKMSDDNAPSIAQLQTFVLTFWPDSFSAEELKAIKIAKSADDLELAVGGFWLMPRKVRFRIEEAFAGSHTSPFVLYTGLGGGDCGLDFRTGERWLISAHRDRAGRWIANLCSQSAPVKDATESLRKLRNELR